MRLSIFLYLTLLLTIYYSCNNKVTEHRQSSKSISAAEPLKILKTKMGTEVLVYSFDAFEKTLLQRNEPSVTYVINFWATWCGPCVAELPYFFKLEEQYLGKDVKFVYVSLDFLKNLETKLLPFLENRNISNKVVVLDQNDVNSWIDKIDKKWSGAIPATLIYNSKRRVLLEQNFESSEELEKALNEIIY